jgi:hypothetical protein
MIKKHWKIIGYLVLLAVLIVSCEDTEIYITNQSSSPEVAASCDSTVLKMSVYQDGYLKTDFSTLITGDKICFRTNDTKNIDFTREVMLMLEVFKDNGKSLCRFRKHLIYKTSYIKLKRVNSDLNIFEIDINSFYPAE